jgi:hypothetical protein
MLLRDRLLQDIPKKYRVCERWGSIDPRINNTYVISYPVEVKPIKVVFLEQLCGRDKTNENGAHIFKMATASRLPSPEASLFFDK